jgi:indole-3-glycerol phosphate synthase
MVRFLEGWLRDVVERSSKRPRVDRRRSRPLYRLEHWITEAKRAGRNAIIAEFKRRSPSGLNVNRDPVDYAMKVSQYGIVGLSVLTEEVYFGGSYEDLLAISSSVKLPILMKDFIVTESQIDTAFNLGADSVLLIVRILTQRELEGLIEYARSYGMEPVVEVHDQWELQVGVNAGARILGFNSRDLSIFQIDISRVEKLMGISPKNVIRIAESGIREREEILKLREAGADAFLIGSSLMQNPEKLKEFV